MSVNAEDEARLTRIAKHYTGQASIPALFNSPEWKAALSKAEGKYKVAVSNLAINRQKNVQVNGWFIADASGTTKEGEQYSHSRILLPDGSTRTAGAGGLALPFLSPVAVTGVEITTNIGAGTQTYRVGRDVTVSVGGHTGTPPNKPFTEALVDARANRGWGNKKLRVNKQKNAFATGRVYEDDNKSIYVSRAEDEWQRVSFTVQDDAGTLVQIDLSPAKFKEVFGLDPTEDIDLAKEAIRGRDVRLFGTIDVLGKLPEDVYKQHEDRLREVIRDFTKKNERGKLELKEPVTVGGYAIQDLYESQSGIVFQVDVSELGYLPKFSVETRSGTKDDKDWVIGAGYNIQFVGFVPGEAIVPSEYRGMDELVQKYLHEDYQKTGA